MLALFQRIGIKIHFLPDKKSVQTVQIAKLALNGPLNVLMAVEGDSLHKVLAEKDKERQALQTEIITTALSAGYEITPYLHYIEAYNEMFTRIAPSSVSKSEVIKQAARKELKTSLWPLLKDSKNRDIAMPLLEAYYKKISAAESVVEPGF
jgi:hypothetical protein